MVIFTFKGFLIVTRSSKSANCPAGKRVQDRTAFEKGEETKMGEGSVELEAIIKEAVDLVCETNNRN